MPPMNWVSTYGPPSRKSNRVNELKVWHWIMMTTASPRIQSRNGNRFRDNMIANTASKQVLQGELNQPRGHRGRGDHAKGGGIERRLGVGELRVIQRVVEFRAEGQ